jgi:hypothetical protein
MKRIFLILLIFVSSVMAYGQYVRPGSDSIQSKSNKEHPKSFWDDFSIGGGFGLQFGSITYIGLSPLLNYHINKSLSIGVGPIYQYLNINDPPYGAFITSDYGGRITAMYSLPGEFSKVFVMGEYDMLEVPDATYNSRTDLVTIPLAGLGYRQPMGRNAYFTIAVLWDFAYSSSSYYISPYTNPVFSAGIDIGL